MLMIYLIIRRMNDKSYVLLPNPVVNNMLGRISDTQVVEICLTYNNTIIFITCNWVDTRWLGSCFTYYIIYVRTMKADYLTVQVWRATCEACNGNLEVSETIPAFAVVHRETKKNLCRDGRSQDLPDSGF